MQMDVKRRKLVGIAGAVSGLFLSGCVPSVIGQRGSENSGASGRVSKTGLSSQEVFDAIEAGRFPGGSGIHEALAELDRGIERMRSSVLRPIADQTVDDLVENLSEPLAKMLSEALEMDGWNTAIPKGNPFQKTGVVRIPNGTKLIYVQKGWCMDPSLPAPGKGDALTLRPMSKRIPDDLSELYSALGRWSSLPENKGHAQGMIWGLMSAGTDRGEWINRMGPSDVARWNSVMPGAADILKRKQSGGGIEDFLGQIGKLIAKDLAVLDDLFKDGPSSEGAARLLSKLIFDGENMKGGKGAGVSEIAPGVHSRAWGNGTLEAAVEIVNISGRDFDFDPTNFYAEPSVRKQGISGTTEIKYAAFSGLPRGEGGASSDRPGRVSGALSDVYSATKNALWASKEKILQIGAEVTFKKSFEWLGTKTPAGASATAKIVKNAGGTGAMAKFAGSLVGATPLLGNLLSLKEAVTGRDWLTGKQLTRAEHVLAVAGTIPGANMLKAAGNGFKAAGASGMGKAALAGSSQMFFQFVDKSAKARTAMSVGMSDMAGEVKNFSVKTIENIKTSISSPSLAEGFWGPETSRALRAYREGHAFF